MINRIICVQQLIACNRQSVLQKILIRTCADGFPKLFAQLFLIDMELFQKVGGVDGGIAVAVPNNVQGLFDLRIIFGDVQRFRVFCMRFFRIRDCVFTQVQAINQFCTCAAQAQRVLIG